MTANTTATTSTSVATTAGLPVIPNITTATVLKRMTASILDLATLLVATFRVGTRLDAAVGLDAASTIVLQQMTATTDTDALLLLAVTGATPFVLRWTRRTETKR